MFDEYKVTVPEGRSGDWMVDHFVIDHVASDRSRLDSLLGGRRGYLPAGTYTRLSRRNKVIMSDTPDEIRDHLHAIRSAGGRVLVAGLGIGVVLQGLLRNDRVEHVTVIENSPDVIRLVAPHYYKMFGHDRLTIIEADIFDWKPPKAARWDYAWFDIWEEICVENRPEFTRLRRKFGRKCKVKAFWCEKRVERMYRHELEWNRQLAKNNRWLMFI